MSKNQDLEKFESKDRFYVPNTARWVLWWGGIDIIWRIVEIKWFSVYLFFCFCC